MARNAMNEIFEVVEVFGKKCLFTCARIDRASVPEGLYTYDIRHDDDCLGIPCEIKPHVLVNHWGTLICKDEIEMSDCAEYGKMFACKYMEEEDFEYTEDHASLLDYMLTA